MSFCSLPTGKLFKKKKKKQLKHFPADYVERFDRNLVDNVDNFLGSKFYGSIANNAEIPSDILQKHILPTSDFAKGMQTDINHYVAKDRINNASFRQKLVLTSKNIIDKIHLLVFEDISIFNAENPIADSLLKKLDVGKKRHCHWTYKKSTKRLSGKDFAIRKRLEKLENRPEAKDDNDNFNLSPSSFPLQPPSFGP